MTKKPCETQARLVTEVHQFFQHKTNKMIHIGAFCLYDNQLNDEFLILTNRTKRREIRKNELGKIEFFESDELDSDLPYEFTGALNKIFNLDKKSPTFLDDSIKIMQDACKRAGLPFIKLKIPLTFKHIRDTHLPNYKGYDIYYDERNGDLGDYELAFSWNAGKSQTSIYRLYEYGEEVKL